MTIEEYRNLLAFYKKELAGERSEQALKDAHQNIQIEIDKLKIQGEDTSHAAEYLAELELLIF